MEESDLIDPPQVVKVKKGQVLYCEGEPCSYVYLIKSGKVNLVKSDNKKIIVIASLEDKNFIGLDSFFADQERKESAIVHEDSELFLIRRNDMKYAMRTCPEWINELMSEMGQRLESTMDLLRDNSISDEEKNIGHSLLPEDEKSYRESIERYRKKKGFTN